MDTMDVIFGSTLLLGLLILSICGTGIHDAVEQERDFALGSAVTTTAAYEYLTNDSFTGAVVRGEGWSDPALTVRNRDGDDRRIATQFLEPIR